MSDSRTTEAFHDYDGMLHYVAKKMIESHCIDEKMYAFFQSEIDYYSNTIKYVTVELAEALSMGDLSENEQYWCLRAEKEYWEGYVRLLKVYLTKMKTLTEQEARVFRKQLCSAYVQDECEIDQIIKNIPANTELLIEGYFYPGFRHDLEACLSLTPESVWDDKVSRLIEYMAYRTAYMQTYYTFREEKNSKEN